MLCRERAEVGGALSVPFGGFRSHPVPLLVSGPSFHQAQVPFPRVPAEELLQAADGLRETVKKKKVPLFRFLSQAARTLNSLYLLSFHYHLNFISH